MHRHPQPSLRWRKNHPVPAPAAPCCPPQTTSAENPDTTQPGFISDSWPQAVEGLTPRPARSPPPLSCSPHPLPPGRTHLPTAAWAAGLCLLRTLEHLNSFPRQTLQLVIWILFLLCLSQKIASTVSLCLSPSSTRRFSLSWIHAIILYISIYAYVYTEIYIHTHAYIMSLTCLYMYACVCLHMNVYLYKH